MPEVPTAWKPLSARSVVVSLLLGAHPDLMSAREVVAAGEHLGLASATTRVALTRAVAAGDLTRTGTSYRLGDRLLARRQRQEQQVADIPWDGSWELAVVVATGRSGADRAALRAALGTARLAELREGVWMRPANLSRALSLEGPEVVQTFAVAAAPDPTGLAATLWDLRAWADEANAVLGSLEGASDPAHRLAVAAHLVRHLATDPLLPPELVPADWPGQRARDASAAYEREIRDISRR